MNSRENSHTKPGRVLHWFQGRKGLSQAVCAALLLTGAMHNAQAQNIPALGSVLVGQDAAAAASNGPVRLAHITYVSGGVTWRADTQTSWSGAAVNLPLRQGAQVLTDGSSRVEIQFDDGARLRLDHNSLLTIQTLYSDTQGEFTELTLANGQAYCRLNHGYSVYQIDTPEASVKVNGPARVRVADSTGARFAVYNGSAVVEGSGGKATVSSGQCLVLANASSPYTPSSMPAGDSWDSWNITRDQHLDTATAVDAKYLPANIVLADNDLSVYGTWRHHPHYGWIWSPRVHEAGWRPYHNGRWVWLQPVGWTWVDSDPWGWAPCHYGTWIDQPTGWAWVPGPESQYWSPAVVSYCQDGSDVAWCALAPEEVRYPSGISIGVGFGGGNWSAFFSIGAAGCYYPTSGGYCVGERWPSHYFNRVDYVNNSTFAVNVGFNRNTYLARSFVPRNARFGGGVAASVSVFGGRGGYRALRNNDPVFAHGRSVGGPGAGHFAVAGPQRVRPTAQSLTTSRTFRQAPASAHAFASRTMFRAPLPRNIPRNVAAAQPGQRFTAQSVRRNNAARPGAIGANPANRIAGANRPGAANRIAGAGAKSPALQQYLKQRAAGRYPTKPGAPTAKAHAAAVAANRAAANRNAQAHNANAHTANAHAAAVAANRAAANRNAQAHNANAHARAVAANAHAHSNGNRPRTTAQHNTNRAPVHQQRVATHSNANRARTTASNHPRATNRPVQRQQSNPAPAFHRTPRPSAGGGHSFGGGGGHSRPSSGGGSRPAPAPRGGGGGGHPAPRGGGGGGGHGRNRR